MEVKHNEDFVKYYTGLKVVPDTEWDAFYNSLKNPLDICFRVNSVDRKWEEVKSEIEKQIAIM